MSNHAPWVAGTDPYQGRCTCHERGPVVNHKWQAEDWVRSHTEQVERARAHLGKTPSLAQSRDYYRQMERTTTDQVVRRQWKMLADELDHRLGNFPHPDSAPLW